MKILFDTNVVLDVLLERQPHLLAAARLMDSVDRGEIKGLLCATTVTTVDYMATKSIGRRPTAKLMRELLTMFQVAAVDGGVLIKALDIGFPDYEDAVLHEAARLAGASGIVTRNRKDFSHAALPIYDPTELIALVFGAKS